MKKENNKNGRHSQESLLGISLLYVVSQIGKVPYFRTDRKAEDPRYQPSGMTTLFNNGFTLIELLVVVLIIGILAAIALPQYEKAVNRARFANLKTLVASFVEAANVYKMANGTWPDNFDDMGLSLPEDFQISTATLSNMNYTCGQNNKIYCCIIPGKSTISSVMICGQNDESFAYHYFLDKGQDYCIAKENNQPAAKMCHSLTRRTGQTLWGLYTPGGYKTGYQFFPF